MSENFEKMRNSKHGRGSASQANKGKIKRRLKHERHVESKKYKGRVRHPNPQGQKVSKRLKNLLDGIPS